jgi:hypothetical protein
MLRVLQAVLMLARHALRQRALINLRAGGDELRPPFSPSGVPCPTNFIFRAFLLSATRKRVF